MIDVEQYIREELQWSPDADEWEKTLVISNLRTFAKHIEHALQQARIEERGRCAQVAESVRAEGHLVGGVGMRRAIAKAIRDGGKVQS